ncbi:MAG: cytochrome c3 family protein [Anaerolineae bacterium]|nr:cytochrome c3 family protein [Anaerolineae bacterium]MBT7190971.1 cytochrome c3 family protein [Anaerolineae bacterium]MBT7989919.1 cytochrome c3 family protein [Anaerolineae bacterium]
MKKILWLTALVILFALGTASFASANGGPHGGYTATTDACAGCHRAHTASGPRLLVEANTTALCMTCHNSAGTGADTNVSDGLYTASRSTTTVGAANTTDGGYLLGGGFVNQGGSAVTSTHSVDGTALAAWGNNGVARGTSQNLASGLTCASCHDPHGSNQYRIINNTVNSNVVAAALVDEGAAKDYDDEHWGAGQSTICAACHSSYHQLASGQGSTLQTGSYTHRIDMQWDADFAGAANPESTGMGGETLPLALTDSPAAGDGVVVCQTCHLPHGSSAAMTGNADGGPDGSGTVPGDTTATDSALLRLDNRGVCEVCHQK